MPDHWRGKLPSHCRRSVLLVDGYLGATAYLSVLRTSYWRFANARDQSVNQSHIAFIHVTHTHTHTKWTSKFLAHPQPVLGCTTLSRHIFHWHVNEWQWLIFCHVTLCNRLSVSLSVYHTRKLCQNGEMHYHTYFNTWLSHHFSFLALSSSSSSLSSSQSSSSLLMCTKWNNV